MLYRILAIVFYALPALVLVFAFLYRRRGVAYDRLVAEEAPVIPGTDKRCERCARQVTTLQPYIDGRTTHWYCAMCVAELDFRHADLRVPGS